MYTFKHTHTHTHTHTKRTFTVNTVENKAAEWKVLKNHLGPYDSVQVQNHMAPGVFFNTFHSAALFSTVFTKNYRLESAC